MDLDSKFNIVPVVEDSSIIEMKIKDKDDGKDKVLDDFEDARENLQNIVKVGAQAIEQLGELSNQSQSAEHYAALSSLIKNVSEVSSTLLKLHKQVEEIRHAPKIEKVETHNHLTVSTFELANMLKNKK
jgi:NADH dehydrogenase/NADH:ubiquinone oxidoreductase subunit G